MCTWRRLTLLLLLAYGPAAAARAQGLPEGPFSLARGPVTVGG